MAVIEVNNLMKHFGHTKAVDGISFNVEKGEIFGFLGPNGAGKTTTIRCFMDFIRPTGGSVRILGKDAQTDAVELKKSIGYLSGYVHLYGKWTGSEHIDFVRRLNGSHDRSKELCERLAFNPQLKSKQLSSGNRQKLGIILAFMTEPEVLILDEPTNALDPLLQQEVYKLLDEAAKRGATVFMSSHNLGEVDHVCSRVGIIRQGKMVTIENIHELKHKRIYTVRVKFTGTYDPNVFRKLGIEVDVPQGPQSEVIMKVKGDLDPLIKQLAAYTVHDIEIEHATLEEIFLEYYHA
ncbi:MAG: ABC transporter ATP-binding protein [Patescibacteria group bacterium]|nr:ABC transporter ATP-binding protein [Patescibacteria group bacterium]MDD5715395.1 ABC transporter ATP-binding protein [Patescibacteria group bacterium]